MIHTDGMVTFTVTYDKIKNVTVALMWLMGGTHAFSDEGNYIGKWIALENGGIVLSHTFGLSWSLFYIYLVIVITQLAIEIPYFHTFCEIKMNFEEW